MNFKIIVILLVAVQWIGCGTEEKPNSESQEIEKTTDKLVIDYSEDELFSLSNELEENLLDTTKSNDYKNNSFKMLDLSQVFVSRFPESKNLRNIIKKGSRAAHGLGQEREAIRLINISIEKFSNDTTIIEEMNLKAFLYDKLNDKANARIAYQAIIDKFPNNPSSVKHKERLKTLDLTDEELLKHFEKINAK